MYKGGKNNMKYSKTIIIAGTIIIIISTLVFLLNKNSQDKNQGNDIIVPNNQSEVTVIKIQPTEPRPPTPTFAPVGTIVKSISGDKIVIENSSVKGSTFTISKSQAGIKYFTRKGEELTPASIDDVKVGQKVTLKIIKPGVEAQFIIEL
jgi:hypothetical protein